MTYVPTESLDGTWAARNTSWRRISQERRRYKTATPVRYWGLTVDALPPSPAGEFIKWWCERWGAFPHSGLSLEDFADNRGRGLWLHGEPGNGKTRAASIAANHMSDLGWSTKFITMANLNDLSVQVLREKDDEQRDRLQGAFDCYSAGWVGWRCVVLDDLGKEHKTSGRWAQDNLDSLIRNRFNDMTPTIVTTNLSMAAIAGTYNKSLRDFIHEAFFTVEFTADSKREELNRGD